MAYVIPRPIFFVVLALLAAAGAGPVCAQRNDARVALLVGISDYPDAAAPLKDPINNMRSMAEELRRDGFEVDVGENLTKEAMGKAIDRFYGQIKSDSVALFFFSGYGIQSDRQTYMIPVNAQIWSEADVRRDGFSLDSILAEMKKRGAAVKIAILDASRRNPLERRFRAVAAGLAPVTVPSGTVVMYGAAPGTVVRDSERELFVSELLKEIRAAGKVEDAFNRTLTGVSRASQNEQVPWFSSTLVEEFSFVSTGRTGEASRRQPPPTPDRDADPRRDYQSAERIGTKAAWQDFVDRYPSGRYSDLARDQLARLEPPSVRPQPQSDQPVRPRPQSDQPPPVRPRPQSDAALQDLDKAIQANPNSSDAFYRRGQLYAKRGDFSRAIEDFDVALRINPRDPEALNNRCWARAVVGELQGALRDCNDALQIRPDYGDAFDSRGFVNLKNGQPMKALADYDASLRINPRLASSLYGRGLAKGRSGNTAGGNADIAAAKAIQPKIADEFGGYGLR
jgi:tetratricopeptide (TPR) repeat protein